MKPIPILLTILVSVAFPLPSHAEKMLINGAGATFPYPLYSKWFNEFTKVDPDAQINYQSIGSGAGIRQLLEKTVDFGASDSPMKDEQMAKANPPVVHIPTVLGAVVLIYNLPGVEKGLKLTPEVLADMYLGKITKWDDPRLLADNPGVKFPKTSVMIIHRSDGSGTTGIFTDYLAKVSPAWKEKVGKGTAVKWPIGLGGKGNEGVTGMVKLSPGSIGYVELIFAEKLHMPYASVKNQAGEFVLPEASSITAAAAGSLKSMPEDFRISITNSAGQGAYPISGFTYLLIPSILPKGKGEKIMSFLRWAMKEGQEMASTLFYAPLPKELVKKVEAKIGTIQVK